MSLDVKYCFDSELDCFNYTGADLLSYLILNDVNVDEIFDNSDNSDSTPFMEVLNNNFNEWYLNTTELNKSIIFYKFLLNSKYQLKNWVNKLHKLLNEIDYKIDCRNNFTTLQYKIEEKNLKLKSSDKNHTSLIREKKYKDLKNLFDFIKMFQKKYYFYLSNTTLTFDQTMRTLYNQNLEEGSKSLDNFINNTNIEKIEEKEIIPKINKKTEKQNKKLMKRMLNKSIGTLKSFLGDTKTNAFLKGEEFSIEGNFFNYKITKNQKYSLLQEQKDTHNVHIPYILNIYNKSNNFLGDMCVTFPGSPILDQILSVYLMISSNNETELLNSSNFYNTTEDFDNNKYIKKFRPDLVKREKITSDFSFLQQNTERIANINDFTKLEKYIQTMVFNRLLPNEVNEFIFKTELVWDEIIDYYMMQDFSMDLLDNLPLKAA